MICKICGQNIDSKSFKSHLKTHNISNQNYYDKYIRVEGEGFCKVCNKPTKFLNITNGYRKHCSNKCAQVNPETRSKYKKTCLIKYGAENVYASNYGKQKIKETCLKHFGVEHALQANIVKNKIKETNLKRHGVENPQQNKEIKEKTNKTNLDRYGNVCAVHGPENWNKAVETMKRRGHYSKLELKLEQFFIEHDILYKSNYSEDSRYPFHCDFYLPEIDTFIEINNFWHHNTHFYNSNNEDDIKTANYWKEKAKTKSQYKVALDVWTIRDLNKQHYAIENKLNYIVLWTKKDINEFIENFYKLYPVIE